MKDGMDYAEMLGLDVASCDVTIKPRKSKKKKDVVGDVIKKVNEAEKDDEKVFFSEEFDVVKEQPKSNKKKIKDFKFDLVYVEGIVVFVLVVGILLTNIFWENSGINSLFKKAFGTEIATDLRTNTGFNAKAPSGDMEVKLADGIMEYSGKGSLYPVCDGEVLSVVEEEGKYTVTLKHSDVFKSVITGVDFVYADKGDDVFKYIPVCFVNGGTAKVYMYNSDVLVTNYTVEGDSIVWIS